MSYSPFRHIGSVFRKDRPIQLTLFLTKRCNSRCPFCFYLSRGGRPEQAEMSLDEIEKLSRSTGSLLWLAFSGGEIFLRDDIVEITRVFYERNRPAIILFPTNGLLTDVIREKVEDILRQCEKSAVVVKLSVDGPEAVHDAIRGMKGSFRKTMRTYEALAELIDVYPNFELGINTVFCASNQDVMDEIIDFASGLEKLKTHTVSLVRGDVSDEGLKDIDIEKYRRAIERMAFNLRSKTSGVYRFRGGGLKAAQDILQRRLIYETMVGRRQLVPCYAGRLNLVVSEAGEVYPCESFTRKLGSLREAGHDLRRILGTRHAEDTLRSINEEKCFCTHECYMMTNILFNPLMYPALLREYMRLR